jgi:hypothetical protein
MTAQQNDNAQQFCFRNFLKKNAEDATGDSLTPERTDNRRACRAGF